MNHSENYVVGDDLHGLFVVFCVVQKMGHGLAAMCLWDLGVWGTRKRRREEGRKEGMEELRKEGRKEGRMEGGREGRKEGKEGKEE